MMSGVPRSPSQRNPLVPVTRKRVHSEEGNAIRKLILSQAKRISYLEMMVSELYFRIGELEDQLPTRSAADEPQE